MSRSFDDLLRSRLGDFRMEPPRDIKELVVGRTARKPNYYLWTALVLLLMGLTNTVTWYFTSQQQSPNFSVSGLPSQADNLSGDMTTPPPVSEFCPEEEAVATSLVVAERHSSENTIVGHTDESSGISLRFNERHQEGKGYFIRTAKSCLGKPDYRLPGRTNKIIPSEKRRFDYYADAGFLFLYNRIAPNPNDEVFVQDFDAAPGISMERLGFTGEAGISHRLTDRLQLRTGVSFSTYRQQYRFDVRNYEPDTVIVTAENRIQPVFNSEEVRVDTRLFLLGVNGTILWAVFPSDNDKLYLGLNYQQLMGNPYMIDYREQSYRVFRSNQVFMNLGLKKTLHEYRNSAIYVIPNIRYALLDDPGEDKILDFKPFSVGVSVSWGMK